MRFIYVLWFLGLTEVLEFIGFVVFCYDLQGFYCSWELKGSLYPKLNPKPLGWRMKVSKLEHVIRPPVPSFRGVCLGGSTYAPCFWFLLWGLVGLGYRISGIVSEDSCTWHSLRSR